MIWEPVDVENHLTSLGKGSSFFLQRIPGKYLVFIYEAELTSLLVLQHEGKSLIVDSVKNIPSKCSVFKITGNNNCILMVDVDKELFYLQGSVGNNVDAFNQNNGNTFLTSDGILSWQRIHPLANFLSMTGLVNAVTLLYHSEAVYAAHYGTVEIKNGLCEITKNRLNDFQVGVEYFVAKVDDELAKIVDEKVFKSLTPAQEILLVIEPSQLYFIRPTPDSQIISQPYSIDLQTDTVVNVLNFKRKGWILIICQSGKILCLRFSNSCRSFQFRHAWLPKAISAVTGHEDNMIYLLWSDLYNLYMTSLGDDNVIKNIKVSKNIRGVRHFVKIDDHIIVITINGCLYKCRIGSVPNQESKFSSCDLLNKMFRTGKQMERLNEEIALKEDLTKAVHIAGIPNISQHLHVTEKDGIIFLENMTEHLFQKGVWRVLIEKEDNERKHLEMKELDNDIVPGGNITIECNVKMPSNLTLVCDIMDHMITIDLEIENRVENTENEQQLLGIIQFLKEKCTFIA